MGQEFGSALREMRGQLGLSQMALADVIGTTQRHLSFLETGRAAPSAAMVTRLVSGLNLSVAQRARLFDASGLGNPYRPTRPAADRVARTLDMMEARILAHWPFPAFVLDEAWNVLRMNIQARAMFAPFMGQDNAAPNLFSLFLSDGFRALVVNWDEASTALYFRLQAAAARSADVAARFKAAKRDRLFDHIGAQIQSGADNPIYVPITLRQPDGSHLQISSLIGQLASIVDAAVEGFEVELMIPLDATSEACLLKNLPNTP